MKNVIRIDLTKFNKEKLTEVAKLYKLDVEILIINKSKDFHTLFVDTDTNTIIAFTLKSDKDSILYTSFLTDKLKEITPVVVVKQPKEMTVDGLLEKVTKYGVTSLTAVEKNFLDTNI